VGRTTGQIIERGTHQELLAKRGFYYNMYVSQFRRVEDGEAEEMPVLGG
jgi:ABC-type transport system involved in cytochrome bd biosynthesis fused ATPase/permease subunit